ncbi:hypothetical protein M8C21_031971 [Ambrosia artemisiifolia]|uniref:Uncharacterized protein n=1 Tax=Ambrosia artemisiifolia TaxID=4212 RepID=A0AAD5C2T5_AMBAR|nr:hypothetical protein M8C21_031971 [Ambrosia artemisiifolia]
MARYGRVYKDDKEQEARFMVFKNNVAYIEEFNSKNLAYKLSVNKFADQTNEEFKTTRNRLKFPPTQTAQTTPFRHEDVTEVPSSMDWRKKGAVTPVKDQGQCVQNKGINTEAAYPYTGSDGTCNTKEEGVHAATISGYENVPANNESALLKAVVMQPVSVAVDASKFQFYSSGVLNGTCGTELDHGVTVVGYGTSDDGMKYWLVKNSWGPDWGEAGYIRMQRDIEAKEGMCGIAMMASYPTA